MKTRPPRPRLMSLAPERRIGGISAAAENHRATHCPTSALGFVVFLILWMSAVSASSQVVDDFESYLDSNDIKGFWKFADLDTDPTHAFDGVQSLIRGGDNVPVNSGWAAWATYVDPFLDLAAADGIQIRARRTLASVDVQFRFSLLDSFSRRCEVWSSAGHAPGAWVLLSIIFDDCPLFDPSEITQIQVNVNNVSSEAGDAYGNFDRVEVVFHSIFSDGFESGGVGAWQPTSP